MSAQVQSARKTVKDIAAAKGGAPLVCLDLGERWLKNIQEPVRIFQIVTSHERRDDEGRRATGLRQ